MRALIKISRNQFLLKLLLVQIETSRQIPTVANDFSFELMGR